jgi:hypothetical protein
MVRAILEGRKTQTRRAVKDPIWTMPNEIFNPLAPHRYGDVSTMKPCPQGDIGDRLWVRETSIIAPKRWAIPDDTCMPDQDGDPRYIQYLASHPDTSYAEDYNIKTTPSIHMPRWASRITLEITSVRVERLNDISNSDCFAEGLPSDSEMGNRTWFSTLWESYYGSGSWDANPWVWVIEFRKLEGGGASVWPRLSITRRSPQRYE